VVRTHVEPAAQVHARPPSGQLLRCGGAQCRPATCDHDSEQGVRRWAAGPAPSAVPVSVRHVLGSPGSPLGESVRAPMEARFGHSFADVRVHSDEAAARSAQAIEAHAYTFGRHVVMGGGWQPDSPSGQHLLAHELTHVIQHSGLNSDPGRATSISDPHDAAEQEAAHVAAHPGREPSDIGRSEGAASVSRATDESELRIARMTPTEKLISAYQRASINVAFRKKIESLITPEALATALISFVAAFLVAQVTPVGWAADIALLLTGAFIGSALVTVIHHLIGFAEARNATTDAELDRAGSKFAAAVAEIEADVLILLITHGLGGGGVRPGPASGPAPGALVLGMRGGEMVAVAVETIPASVALPIGVRAAGVSMAMMSGSGGGDGPPKDLSYDEKWEQAERARREQEQAEATRNSSQVAEAYDTPEAATGQLRGLEPRGTGVTRNPGLREQGYTETRYYYDDQGQKWTVHYNPRTGKFTGAHHSTPDD
jgi:Domain of unknown function (DUF4157)